MRKNMLAQLIFRVILCVVSAFAVLISLGIFYLNGNGGNGFSWGFLKYYTNLSNYLVFIVSVIVLSDTVKRVKNGEREGYNRKIRTFKFMTVVMILVTFLVVIFLLDSPLKASYWLNVGNMSYHFMAPLLFILDYLLFDEKCTITVLAPLYSLILPLIYVGYVFILGAVVPNFEYPYFFLNVNELGYSGVLLWTLALMGVFTVLGYLLWLFNRFENVDGKWRLNMKNVLFPLKKQETEKLPVQEEEAA